MGTLQTYINQSIILNEQACNLILKTSLIEYVLKKLLDGWQYIITQGKWTRILFLIYKCLVFNRVVATITI